MLMKISKKRDVGHNGEFIFSAVPTKQESQDKLYMQTVEKSKDNRKNPRIKTANLVDYTLFDQDGKPLGQGKGRTINLSLNGILLKTTSPLQGVYVLLMTIDLNGNDVKVEGRLVYSTEDGTGHYLSGIEFKGPMDRQVDAIVAFVKTYQQTRHRIKKEAVKS